jgi:hypothetical protein
MAVGAVPRAVPMLGGGVVADRFGPFGLLGGVVGLRSPAMRAARLGRCAAPRPTRRAGRPAA